MSDYEDIWLDTLPKHQAKVQMAKYKFLQSQQQNVGLTGVGQAVVGQNSISPPMSERERSITPAESENNFKVKIKTKKYRLGATSYFGCALEATILITDIICIHPISRGKK